MRPREALRLGNQVGYVPQNPQAPVALPLTARQAVRLAVSGRAGFLRRPKSDDLAWADAMLERIAGEEAAELARTPVTRLSGGQLQQVFLARALANRPRLLLLDEPTLGLDRPAVSRLTRLLEELRREREMAILIATHDHLTAMAVAGELIYLDTTVRYQGPSDTLPAHLDARLCHHDHAANSPEES
jgi:ABC-type Mn2+/Zn2+ transport system ATPase subunit